MSGFFIPNIDFPSFKWEEHYFPSLNPSYTNVLKTLFSQATTFYKNAKIECERISSNVTKIVLDDLLTPQNITLGLLAAAITILVLAILNIGGLAVLGAALGLIAYSMAVKP